MPKPLVIVESPAKARTLARFLGTKYRVEASYGHIRDLPDSASEVPKDIKGKSWGRLGVDTDGDFTPHYVVPADKKKYVQHLKDALKDASELILATDPDREGESISWHLQQILKPKVKVRRIVFHEITEEAVSHALAEAHEQVDENLVRAQESRRILDRLYGYTLSPVLWKKVQTGLSAGRVQSVAVRLIVEREEERLAFRTAGYWDLEARLRADGSEFTATLARVGDQRVATGKDFDQLGVLTSKNVTRLDETSARAMVEALGRHLPWTVTAVDEKPVAQRPAPPFTTSTLQQEANRKLGFSSERTMQIAQRLFQGMDVGGGDLEGLISYHRTDSTTLSDKALAEAGQAVRDMYGAEFYKGPRQYQTKVRNAQEAHEAIRPTEFRRTPQSLERVLDSDEMRLYDLIWKRAIASQMAEARLLRTSVEITGAGANGTPAVLTASGKAIEFAGFLRAYVEGSDDPSAELGGQETLLPKMTVGERVQSPEALDARVIVAGIDAKGHQTTPPARYTEASLVKRLEEEGIGRPSTYAPTVATIQRRGYVTRQGKALVPSFTAFAVTRLLREHFGDYVDLGFTAEMEEMLDKISNGEKDWLDFIRSFYRGDGKHTGLETIVADKGQDIAYPMLEVGVDPESGKMIRVRIGRYGPFLQLGDQADEGPRASIPEDVTLADLSVEKASALLKAKAEGPKNLGVDPDSSQNVYVMLGRFGPYVQLGETPEKGSKEKPRRASLGRSFTEETITLPDALKLLSLPRTLGAGDDGEEIVTNVGRFGPYVKHGTEFRSLEPEDDVYTITFARAKDLLAQPKKSARRQRAAAKELKALGAHPDSGAAVRILDGRYGPYVTDGTTNASLPKGRAPEEVTMDEAKALLEARAGAPSSKRRGGRGAKAAKSAKVAKPATAAKAPKAKTAKKKTAKTAKKRTAAVS
ncbi:MAG: type I DNA topoisomerase [Vicinamibacterales bacterium]|nr:type I DNA topoisomerase [Vicinamibacterales bacterium]